MQAKSVSSGRQVCDGRQRSQEQDAVRIAAELVRAADGKQLWSDKYEPAAEDISISGGDGKQIAATIEPELSKVGSSSRPARRRKPGRMGLLPARSMEFWRFTTPGFDLAETYFSVRLQLIRILRAPRCTQLRHCSARLLTSRRSRGAAGNGVAAGA